MIKKDVFFWAIVLASLVGIGVSAYSLAHHYDFVSGAICTINDTLNCDVVNKGPYSEIFGIPVALLGVLGYGGMLLSAILRRRNPEDKGLTWFLGLAVLGGLAFSFYLTGIEAFIIKAWCLLCITSQIAMLVIAGSVAGWMRKEKV